MFWVIAPRFGVSRTAALPRARVWRDRATPARRLSPRRPCAPGSRGRRRSTLTVRHGSPRIRDALRSRAWRVSAGFHRSPSTRVSYEPTRPSPPPPRASVLSGDRGDSGARRSGSPCGALLALWALAHAAYLAAARVVTRQPGRVAGIAPRSERRQASSALWIVIGVALLARLVSIPSAADALRRTSIATYGMAAWLRVASILSPRSRRPGARAAHDPLVERINHRGVADDLPPAAQLLFGAVARIEA